MINPATNEVVSAEHRRRLAEAEAARAARAVRRGRGSRHVRSWAIGGYRITVSRERPAAPRVA